ncbi:DUF4854 domain-containing protein [Hominenteromicrobium sp.]|uniref:DUF4854 domain-containing protein n=1 Tax=Hominenteromicrobium sp. TaxID=3073581 RepID=UPI003AB7E106
MKLRKLCALALAGLLTLSALAGCTSAKTIVGGNTSSTSDESSSSSEAASEDSTASSESSASTGEAMFASLADYLADPDVKASIDAEIENQTDDSMTIKVYADGNALVYEYQFTDEYDLSDEDIKQSVLDALKEGCEENASTFEDIADTLESEVGLSGVHVRLVYLNGDGSEIYTHDFE